MMSALKKRGSRRTFGMRGVALLAVCLLLAAACGGDEDTNSSGEGQEANVRLVNLKPSPISPVYYDDAIAMELGLWEEEGLDVETISIDEGAASAVQQLVAGNGDILTSAGTSVVVEAIEEEFGDEIRIIGSKLYDQPYGVVTFPDSDIESVDDLAGKKIGVSDVSGGEVPFLEAMFATHGISDYELIPIGGGEPQTIKALEGREVDAYSTALKDFLALGYAGLEMRTVPIPEWEPLAGSLTVVRTDFLEENRDAVVGFMRGLAKANVFAHENLEAAAEITANQMEAPPPMEETLDQVEVWLGASMPEELIEEGTPFMPDVEGIEAFVEYFRQAEMIPPDLEINVDDFMDLSIAPAAGEFDPEPIRELAQDYDSSS